MNKKIITRKFETLEKLEGAIVRQWMKKPQAILFIGPKAIQRIGDEMIIADSFWGDWPKVDEIKINGEFQQFKKVSDGEELFFYELE